MKRVVLIGAGGIGAPCAIALAAAGVEHLVVVDQDRIEASNLHRQILFGDEDVGREKVEVFKRALSSRNPRVDVQTIIGRATPTSIHSIVEGAAVVIDATDNFASRFLIADACHLASVPVIHAASIRWNATVLAVSAHGKPCYRCVFEDIPRGDMPDCATAGVVGPVCGVAGAVAADRALSILDGDESVFGTLVSFDGRRDRLRSVRFRALETCALCGSKKTIRSIDESRYVTEPCF